MVARAFAERLAELGHDVVIGTRDVKQTLARTAADALGTPPYAQWQTANAKVRLLSFADAGAHGELVINATAGAVSLAALEGVGESNLAGKVLLDVALPLDLSDGMPPRLLFANTDSLGEQIQRAFPDARVVKSLTTVFAQVMVDPAKVPGRHDVFVGGDDAGAKATVKGLLLEFGWPQEAIIDLGSIRTARATEMYAPLFFALVGALGGSWFLNIAVVRAPDAAVVDVPTHRAGKASRSAQTK
jgi:predicted dinucleotide-binding enzyme